MLAEIKKDKFKQKKENKMIKFFDKYYEENEIKEVAYSVLMEQKERVSVALQKITEIENFYNEALLKKDDSCESKS